MARQKRRRHHLQFGRGRFNRTGAKKDYPKSNILLLAKRMTNQVCARPGCGKRLNALTVQRGDPYCSRTCGIAAGALPPEDPNAMTLRSSSARFAGGEEWPEDWSDVRRRRGAEAVGDRRDWFRDPDLRAALESTASDEAIARRFNVHCSTVYAARRHLREGYKNTQHPFGYWVTGEGGRLLRSDMPIAEIARKTGHTVTYIYDLRHHYGVTREARDEEQEERVDRASAGEVVMLGATVEQAASLLGGVAG